MSPEEKKQADMWCLISIACEVIPLVVLPMFTSVFASAGGPAFTTLTGMLESLGGIAMLAGFVIMIYVRVRYPKSIFGKVLMWVYIAMIIIALILFIAVLVICATICNGLGADCGGCLTDCSRMGFLLLNR